MKQVAKLVIVDNTNHYLILERSDHPAFPNDPDLPGGTVEEGESGVDAMIREVVEEAGITIDPKRVEEIYTGSDYSIHHTVYNLYIVHVDERPEVAISWEHASYAWLTRDAFLKRSGEAIDSYMRMVHDVVSGLAV